MNDQPPPARVTRARAAAKEPDISTSTTTTAKNTKIAAAASKTKTTRAAPLSKRKTRADDSQMDEMDELAAPVLELPKPTRGRRAKTAPVEQQQQPEPEMNEAPVRRTRKTASLQPEPDMELPARTARGRPKRATVEASAPEPTRSLRGRKKLEEVSADQDVALIEEPVKKSTRGRAATITKAPPKKSVKFQEPDKENFVPLLSIAKGKAKAADIGTGLKAKPVRKPAARATRGRPQVEEPKSSPLSPKKATQVATAKDNSDDELATTEKTPMKPLMKSPIKAPGSIFGTAKKLNFSSSSITVNRVVTHDPSASIMGSPARRAPQSVIKDSLKVSPQRGGLGESMFKSPQRGGLGDSMFKSPFKFSLPGQKPTDSTSSPFKTSLLQSPARRPQSPTKVTEAGSPCKATSSFAVTPKASIFKISRFAATPRTLPKSVSRPGQMLPPTTSNKIAEEAEVLGEDIPKLSFTGRLSSIVPRDADPNISVSESVAEGEDCEASEIIPEEVSMNATSATNECTDADAMDIETDTPSSSPPQVSNPAYGLREIDESPFDDTDSEDELASSSPQYSPVALRAFDISSRDFAKTPATPNPFQSVAKTPRTVKSAAMRKSEKLGFTPLARQLSDWMAASPEKSERSGSESDETLSPPQVSGNTSSAADHGSPLKSTFFDDEMTVMEEMQAEEHPEAQEKILETINFTPVELDEQDMALAEEAEEMSILGPEELYDSDQDDQAPVEHDDVDELSADAEAQAAVDVDELELLDTIDTSHEDMDKMNALEETEAVDDVQALELFDTVTTEEGVADEMEEFFEPEQDTFNVKKQFQTVEEEFGISRAESAGPSTEPELALSEASQEYPDENDVHIDPELLALPAPSTPKYATPKRVLAERVFHTVSKVPLKAAANDSPMHYSPLKRSASISKLPVQRPSGNLSRSNTVISYSPSKRTPRAHRYSSEETDANQSAYTTPSKPDTDPWSIAATPARTPRSDLNTALLKGAVVYVDVHTTEGADASLLFTELLTQMGARCVKRWDWNGNSDEGSKIGITHVVFKDGGKRTLEKARETGGVVSCVGVGWVLE